MTWMCIGVAGQFRQGKDTIADRLADMLNERGGPIKWRRSAFAKEVKRVFAENFFEKPHYNQEEWQREVYEFIETWKVKPDPPIGFDSTVRRALQIIGDGFRQIKDSIWIDLCFRSEEPKIISDVRYLNEFRRIHEVEGYNILVARPDKINDDPNGSEAQIRPFAVWALENLDTGPMHVEVVDNFTKDLAKFRYFIRNSGSLEDLYQKVEGMLPSIDEWLEN